MSAARPLSGSVSVPVGEPCSDPSLDVGAVATALAASGAVGFVGSVLPASTTSGANDASGRAGFGMASAVFSAWVDGGGFSDLAAAGGLRIHWEGSLPGVLLPSFNTGVIETAIGREFWSEMSASTSAGDGIENAATNTSCARRATAHAMTTSCASKVRGTAAVTA